MFHEPLTQIRTFLSTGSALPFSCGTRDSGLRLTASPAQASAVWVGSPVLSSYHVGGHHLLGKKLDLGL